MEVRIWDICCFCWVNNQCHIYWLEYNAGVSLCHVLLRSALSAIVGDLFLRWIALAGFVGSRVCLCDASREEIKANRRLLSTVWARFNRDQCWTKTPRKTHFRASHLVIEGIMSAVWACVKSLITLEITIVQDKSVSKLSFSHLDCL